MVQMKPFCGEARRGRSVSCNCNPIGPRHRRWGPRDRSDWFQSHTADQYAELCRCLSDPEAVQRAPPSAKEIAAEIQAKIAQIKEGFAFVLNPPPVLGLGQGAGYSLFVEDRAGAGFGALQQAANTLQSAVVKTPGMGFPFVGYQSNVPQLDIRVDRVKAKAQGVALTNLFETLQV